MKIFYPALSFLLVIIAGLMCGCSDDRPQEDLPTNSELSRMTPEERQAKAPNNAFEGVFEKSPEAVQRVLEDNPTMFLPKNQEGKTPLMIAIELRQEAIAMQIARELSIEDLKTSDNEGRGYISYAAEYGHLSLIELIAEKYKGSLRFGLARFHNIDFLDNNDRNALFYAANASVAKLLKDYWMQWTLTWSTSWTFWSGFYSQKDNLDQNFFHTAASDNRHDLLKWATQELCGEHLFEGSEFLKGAPSVAGLVLDYLGGALQRAPLIPDDLINSHNLEGNTPLHQAVRNGHVQASQVLMTCRFVNFRAQNNFDRNPLAELLVHIDRNQASVPRNYKRIFDSLIEQRNYISLARNFLKNMINDEDVEGNTSLHYAARLKDPYFYNKLKDVGDVYRENDNDETPRGLFSAVNRSGE